MKFKLGEKVRLQNAVYNVVGVVVDVGVKDNTYPYTVQFEVKGRMVNYPTLERELHKLTKLAKALA